MNPNTIPKIEWTSTPLVTGITRNRATKKPAMTPQRASARQPVALSTPFGSVRAAATLATMPTRMPAGQPNFASRAGANCMTRSANIQTAPQIIRNGEAFA